MKKVLIIVLCAIAVLCFTCFFACSSNDKDETSKREIYEVYAYIKRSLIIIPKHSTEKNMHSNFSLGCVQFLAEKVGVEPATS